MENLRIKFLPNKQKEFLDTVYRVSGLNMIDWQNLQKFIREAPGIEKRETNTTLAAELFCEMFKIFLPRKKHL